MLGVSLHVDPEGVVNVHLEGFEPFRVGLEPLCPIAPLFLAEVVASGCMGIEQHLIPEVAAQQLRNRLVKDLARQIPESHVDAAQNFDLPPALWVAVEHVVRSGPGWRAGPYRRLRLALQPAWG